MKNGYWSTRHRKVRNETCVRPGNDDDDDDEKMVVVVTHYA